jgi:hypothetical protein
MRVGKGNDPIAWIAWTIAIIAIIFVVLTWLANPLMNIAMRFHPHGRYALTPDQRQQSTFIGCTLLASVGLLILELVNNKSHLCSVMMLLTCLPILLIHLSERGWPRRVCAIVACTFVAMVLEVTTAVYLKDPLLPIIGENMVKVVDKIGMMILAVYFWAVLIWSFVGQYVVSLIPKR